MLTTRVGPSSAREVEVAGGDGRCGECRSANLEVVSIREVHQPPRKGKLPDAQRPVVARKVEVRCRRSSRDRFLGEEGRW